MVTSYEDVRPEVKAFAVLMERELRENDHKGGWKDCNAGWLLERMAGELGELHHAFMFGRQDEAQASEAVDVAAFAMMFCDALGQLPTLPASTRYAELERAARELLDAHDATVYRAMMPRRKRVETPPEQVLALHGRLADAKTALRAALANLDEAKADE